MYGEASTRWLPRVYSHELLEPSETRREKSIDVNPKYHDWFTSFKDIYESQVDDSIV